MNATSVLDMKENNMLAGKWRKMILLHLSIGIILATSTPVMAEQPLWRSASAISDNEGNNDHLSFQCPKAFLGIKGDMLPTHWQADDHGSRLKMGHASIHGDYMICSYRAAKNRQQRFGPIRRLVPRGYRCMSDGIGTFRCQKKFK